MAIIRVCKDKENPYVMLNKTSLKDTRLSWKAKGILAYLLSLPDDWQIYEEELTTHADDGIKSTRSGLHELIKYGYIIRQQIRDKNGKFQGYEYGVYEVPTEMPKAENGKTENRKKESRKGHATNNNLTYNYKTNNYVVVEAYTSAKGKSPTKAEKDKLIDLFNNYSEELILKAIDMTVEQAEHFNLKYIRSILESFKSKGLNTLQDVETCLRNDLESKQKGIQKDIKRKTCKPKNNGEIDFNNGSNLFNGYKNKRTIEDIKRDMGIEV